MHTFRSYLPDEPPEGWWEDSDGTWRELEPCHLCDDDGAVAGQLCPLCDAEPS